MESCFRELLGRAASGGTGDELHRRGTSILVRPVCIAVGFGRGLGLGVLSWPGDMRECCVYGSVVEEEGTGVTAGLRLEGSMLPVMVGGDVET